MINGILNIYKEKGYTSHDVVAKLRKIIGQKKIGHTGTLDPDAEGVLPVCIGRATKVCDMLTERDKTYEAVLLLGKTTDTQDISGTVLEERATDGVTEEQAEECIRGFEGEYDQVPPMYSALKVNGKKLYELAREGKTVERKSRRVRINRIRILEISLPRIRMEVSCSKGTYIRTLCQDIGERLGTGGCMESLLRTRSGRFGIEESLRLDEVEKAVSEEKLDRILIPLDSVFEGALKGTVTGGHVQKAYNGNSVPAKGVTLLGTPEGIEKNDEMQGELQSGRQYRLYDPEGRFIGIYRLSEDNRCFELEKMFLDPEEVPSGRMN